MKGRLSAAWKAVRAFVSAHRPGLLRAGIGAGIAFIVLLVHRSAYNLLVTQPQYRVKPAARVHVAPVWGAGESAVELPADLSLFDEGLVARLGRSFEQNPWVKRVTCIERVFPDRVRVKFEARRPHLALRRADGVYLIDDEGVLLPGVYPSAPACGRTIEVVGVTATPPRPGQRWEDAQVKAGAELAEIASSTPALKALGVRAVDVSNAGGRIDRRRPETAFVTGGGCTIYWGRSPSAARFGEPTPAEKLELLAAVLKEYPKLGGVRYVKLHTAGQAAVSPGTHEVRVGRRTPR